MSSKPQDNHRYRTLKPGVREEKFHKFESNVQQLKRDGIGFRVTNGGHQLVIVYNGKRVRFYPGTGSWHSERGSLHGMGLTKQGNGLQSLYEYLGITYNEPNETSE